MTKHLVTQESFELDVHPWLERGALSPPLASVMLHAVTDDGTTHFDLIVCF